MPAAAVCKVLPLDDGEFRSPALARCKVLPLDNGEFRLPALAGCRRAHPCRP
ncbi:hypothetical protein [Streptomyces sp. NPDC054783]